MRRNMLYAKIHRAVITQADLDYEGSVTIDAVLLDAAGILEHEAVHIWNVTRATRLTTYALRGEAGSGVICVNGAAAHGNRPGDVIIIAAFAEMSEDEARGHQPRVVRVDPSNHLVSLRPEVPGPGRLTAIS